MINNIFQAKYAVSKLKDFSCFADAEKLVSTYMKTGLLVYPHQIVAALSALDNPLKKGFILADEVGLGKGIEAMLVVSQHYYEGKRICIVVPNPLMPMWRELITDKFGLEIADGIGAAEDKIVLTTYTTAVEKAEELKAARFDYAVFEEAHRLRKFHTGENKTASVLHAAFEGVKKLLLTATPMQKNVMDIYGLVNFIDAGALGDADDFYKRYYKKPENYAELKDILAPYIFRTLRSQVKADVNLPERNILTYSYKLEKAAERELNDRLFKYLGKSKKVAFPEMDTYELTLMLEKIFASSIYALSKTLANITMRLRKAGTAEAQAEADEIQEMLTLATSIKDTSKEDAFVRTLNGIVKNRESIMQVVGDCVNEALAEVDELMDDSEVIAIDAQIDKLQTRIMELTKQRGKREIDAEQYNTESREVMEKLNALFAEREAVAEARNTATLSKAFQAVVADFLSKAGAQAEFDRDIFARLVDTVRIKSHDKIIFILKDGTEVKATTAAVAA